MNTTIRLFEGVVWHWPKDPAAPVRRALCGESTPETMWSYDPEITTCPTCKAVIEARRVKP